MKHGQCSTPEYSAWQNMLARCRNKNFKHFKNYGGRGIRVCDRWRGENGFQNFYHDLGRRPSPRYSLDRINNDGDYEPRNCRWATRLQQAANKRAMCRHGMAKLKPKQVLAIRNRKGPLRLIAEAYGISQGHVSHIKNRDFWKTL